jgi:hypothetical protein
MILDYYKDFEAQTRKEQDSAHMVLHCIVQYYLWRSQQSFLSSCKSGRSKYVSVNEVEATRRAPATFSWSRKSAGTLNLLSTSIISVSCLYKGEKDPYHDLKSVIEKLLKLPSQQTCHMQISSFHTAIAPKCRGRWWLFYLSLKKKISHVSFVYRYLRDLTVP